MCLAEEGRGLHLHRRLGQPRGGAHERDATLGGMVDVLNEVARLEVGIVEEVDRVHHGAAGDAPLAEALHRFLLGPAGGPFGELGVQRVTVLATALQRVEALVC